MPGTHKRGLIRVDVMQRENKKLVVNEFESLEAMYSGSPTEYCITYSSLSQYWQRLLHAKLAELEAMHFSA